MNGVGIAVEVTADGRTYTLMTRYGSVSFV